MKKQLSGLLPILVVSIAWFVIGWSARDLAGGSDLRLFAQARQEILGKYQGQLPSSQDLTYAAIRGMLGELNDPYTAFYEPALAARFTDDFNGEIGRLGLVYRKEGDLFRVASMQPGSPAEQGGLQIGDVLLVLDGVPLRPDTPDSIVGMLLRGPLDQPARVQVRRGEQTLDFEILRQPWVLEQHHMLAGQVAYLEQSAFFDLAPQAVRPALQALLAQQPVGLVWDLRPNGGGSMASAQTILSYFFRDGVLFRSEERGGRQREFRVVGDAFAADLPLVILVGPDTASSGETAALTVQERDRGLVLGQVTHGKGTIQTTVPLANGCMLHYTVAKWLSPQGVWINGTGMTPDYILQDDPATPQDELLEAALAYLLRGETP